MRPRRPWADRGQVIEERDEIHGAVDDIDGELKEIIAAEARLADGSYGICRNVRTADSRRTAPGHPVGAALRH